ASLVSMSVWAMSKLYFPRGNDPPGTPQITEGLRPSLAPGEDGAEGAPPPAPWLGFKPCGCCWQAIHNTDRLSSPAVSTGVREVLVSRVVYSDKNLLIELTLCIDNRYSSIFGDVKIWCN